MCNARWVGICAAGKPGWKMASKKPRFLKKTKSPKFSLFLFFGQILYKSY